ncbi:ThiF family adenylyltransferase [Sphaerospermopsis aphanizomenoides BCCUSP55]|uniref:HesA/MoeB/ThiF family protein n=1 Tax=Sphaerospermopsis aphanizomenoides TaxID=459663 RepID=UPI001906A994|nr:ThiF family adenylyltransferase [Sphaerospermopsis aphanizomenoides]MBK1986792.1 ThiF family adenylyltransferase [Sphaerospermopsis aphanizomenoides BCCUSP55]
MNLLTTNTKFQIKRSLSIKLDQDRPVIWIGNLPPNAIKIEHPPLYLAMMLETLSIPYTFAEIWQKINIQYPQAIFSDVEKYFNDLLELGVIHPQLTEGRYHRHQLYFDFFDVLPENYEQIVSTKTVGLIGSGGIGSTVALLLATAGVGTLIVSDNDDLEESNLTRTILFDESDIGTSKVVAAKTKLQARNHQTTVIPIQKMCNGVNFVKENFANCDVLVLSADHPSDIHNWVNTAAIELQMPYISVGYIEIFGSIGPFIIPGVTGCYNCHLMNQKQSLKNYRELNHNFQTASYGSLNALVSSIAVNEIIRYFFTLDIKTLGQQMLIKSNDYSISFVEYQKHEKCFCSSLI